MLKINSVWTVHWIQPDIMQIDGQNISGLEIHVFEDSSSNPGSGDFSGSEIRLATSYMFDNLSNWNTFDKNSDSRPYRWCENLKQILPMVSI